MRWSVAIFGHEKPGYYFIDEKPDLRTAQFLSMPPRAQLPTERLHICTGNETRNKVGDIVAFMPVGHKWGIEEVKGFLIVEVEDFTRAQMEALCEPYYDITDYDFMVSEMPLSYLSKRRFQIPVGHLMSAGVDLGKMKARDLKYTPKLRVFGRADIFDKINERTLGPDDQLNMIGPKDSWTAWESLKHWLGSPVYG